MTFVHLCAVLRERWWGLGLGVLLATVVLGCRSSTVVATPNPVEVPSPSPSAVPEQPEAKVELAPIGEGLWLHTSTRELAEYGVVQSHGLVVDHPDGPLLVDTAWGDEPTERLLAAVKAKLGRLPAAAVITDFHSDRAGGIDALRSAGVDVFSSGGVIDRLGRGTQLEALDGPLFAGRLGGPEVEVFFPGPGHSPENLVVWLPQKKVLFGGCLVRPYASRDLGNVGDADLDGWGPSVLAVRERYGDATMVIPSHGPPRGPELLDHTLALVEAGLAARARKDNTEAPPTRMAITVDDLPQHGPLPQGVSRTDVHTKLLAAFARHAVPKVRGFVIGRHAQSNPDHREALRRWVAAGHPLGNHTWSHPEMKQIGIEGFLADIDRAQAPLAALTGDDTGESWRSFRYPYLQQGFDAESSSRVRAHLAASGYQVAEVSIDFWDWDYQAPYVRCLEAGGTTGVDALRKTYLSRAVEMLQWHRVASQSAFGRPIAHVLLLHAGAFTAEMIEPLLEAYEARGVVWIGLDEALADPVYRDVPLPPKTRGDVIVEQAVTSLGAPHPPWPRHPGPLLRALCD